MKAISRLLIAYDGSQCSDAVLKDLRRAGLPASVEAVVASIAYVFVPSEVEVADDGASMAPGAALVRPSQLRALKSVKHAVELAQEAAARVKTNFAGWSVRAEAEGGTPAWELVLMASNFNVDLIAMGSHSHLSAGGRLILGSVSQRVLYDAPCSVRVVRCVERQHEEPIRIAIGLNGSAESEAALNAVILRAWPPKTEVLVISADQTPGPSIVAAEERLRATGLITRTVNRDGDPATVLIEEADKFNADSIFVGTRDLHGFQHLLHGSVSSAVAARAHCSVEVVRTRKQNA